MSCLPSPLKSPTPAICQLRSVADTMETEFGTVPEVLINPTRLAPVEVLRQSRSGTPSPLKSPRTDPPPPAVVMLIVALELLTEPQALLTRTQYVVATVGETMTDDPVAPAIGEAVLPLAPTYHW